MNFRQRSKSPDLVTWLGVLMLLAIIMFAFGLYGCATQPKNFDQTVYVAEATVLGVQTAVANCSKDPQCKVSNADLSKAEDGIAQAAGALQAARTASKAGDSTTAQGKLQIAQAALQAASVLLGEYLSKR